MNLVPNFLRGSYGVGPNGFWRFDPDKRYFSIHWFSTNGLTVTYDNIEGKRVNKVFLKPLAKFLLKRKLKKENTI